LFIYKTRLDRVAHRALIPRGTMNRHAGPKMPAKSYWPLGQLVLARLREFYREPMRMFWVYGMPVLVTVGLGIAFRNKDVQQVAVDIVAGPRAEEIAAGLPAPAFIVRIAERDTCRRRLRTARTDVVVEPGEASARGYRYSFDPSRPESVLARER